MQLTQITTNLATDTRWQSTTPAPCTAPDLNHAVCLYPEITFQTFQGFGGAFTEAAGYNWLTLDAGQQEAFAAACFGPEGLGYTLGRAHMGSCDFALGNYAALAPGREDFDLSHDETYIFPLLRAAARHADAPIGLLLSPWSPPAFMKTNKEMNHGGALKPEFYAAWAECMAQYARCYQSAGFDVRQISVQNEPEAVQTWDSCIYTAPEEGRFAADFLRPALDAAGLGKVKILIWDHNKEALVRRMQGSLATPHQRAAIGGAAFHWYTGDHFEAVELARALYPDKELYFTEGCVEYSRFDGASDLKKAEMYAHDILGNLNAGANGSIDWNLLLNAQGGPNHVGNFCEAPIMLNGQGGFERKGSYWYIGQFSRCIRPGAVRIGLSRWCAELEATAFQNTDGSIALVLLNRTAEPLPACILQGEAAPVQTLVEPHSLVTLLLR